MTSNIDTPLSADRPGPGDPHRGSASAIDSVIDIYPPAFTLTQALQLVTALVSGTPSRINLVEVRSDGAYHSHRPNRHSSSHTPAPQAAAHVADALLALIPDDHDATGDRPDLPASPKTSRVPCCPQRLLEFTDDTLLFAAIGVMTLAAALLPRLLGNFPSRSRWCLRRRQHHRLLIPGPPRPTPERSPRHHPHLDRDLRLGLLEEAPALPSTGRCAGEPGPPTWRLLAITMPLSIAAKMSSDGWGSTPSRERTSSRRSLRPTDPVLATEVQVSEPVDDENADDEVRFALTSEAGLNDGLAFPFTYAAIAISMVGLAPSAWFTDWFLIDVLWRITIGVIAGIGTGWPSRRSSPAPA